MKRLCLIAAYDFLTCITYLTKGAAQLGALDGGFKKIAFSCAYDLCEGVESGAASLLVTIGAKCCERLFLLLRA